ncbi:MAG TPA: helix-turn-helix domain-containing protein [Bacteroidia bacterium]|nr:helix-turn-helix domain-containing protein [Bacteroidia bacterium]HRS60004.1 helix-turn-helix domain-containing protein [Bacteroidia bacterium]
MNKIQQIVIEKIDSEDFFSQIREILRQEVARMHPESEEIHSELMTRKETADFLNISLVCLNNWTKTGILTSYNISGKVYYKRHEIMQALQKNKNLKYKRDK